MLGIILVKLGDRNCKITFFFCFWCCGSAIGECAKWKRATEPNESRAAIAARLSQCSFFYSRLFRTKYKAVNYTLSSLLITNTSYMQMNSSEAKKLPQKTTPNKQQQRKETHAEPFKQKSTRNKMQMKHSNDIIKHLKFIWSSHNPR